MKPIQAQWRKHMRTLKNNLFYDHEHAPGQ